MLFDEKSQLVSRAIQVGSRHVGAVRASWSLKLAVLRYPWQSSISRLLDLSSALLRTTAGKFGSMSSSALSASRCHLPRPGIL